MIRQSLLYGIMFFFFVLTGLTVVDKAKQSYAGTQGFEADYTSGLGRYLFFPSDTSYYKSIKAVPDRSIQMVDPITMRIQWFGKLFSIGLSLLALSSFLIQRNRGHRAAAYWISFLGSFLFLREVIISASMFIMQGIPCQEASFYQSLGIASNWRMIELIAGGSLLFGIMYTIMMIRLLDTEDRWPVLIGGASGTLLAAVFWILFFGEWVLG